MSFTHRKLELQEHLKVHLVSYDFRLAGTGKTAQRVREPIPKHGDQIRAGLTRGRKEMAPTGHLLMPTSVLWTHIKCIIINHFKREMKMDKSLDSLLIL